MEYKNDLEQKIIATFAHSVLKASFNEADGKEALKKIFLVSYLTPQDVLAQTRRTQLRSGIMNTAIYEDIGYALYYEMRDNKDSRVVAAVYERAIQMLENHGKLKEFRKWVRAVKEGNDFPYGSGFDAVYSITYLILLYEKAPMGPVLYRCMMNQYEYLIRNHPVESTETNMGFISGYLLDDGTPIIESKAYQRYDEEARQKLAEYLSQRYPSETVTSENLAQVIAQNVHCGVHWDKAIQDVIVDKIDERDDAILSAVTWIGVSKYQFSHDMLVSIMGDGALGNTRATNYHPEVEPLIDLAIQSYVRPYFELSQQKKLTRNVLRKEIAPRVTENIEAFYNNITNLYYIDCLFKVLEECRDEYYFNFSWFYDIEKADEFCEEAKKTTDNIVSCPIPQVEKDKYAKLDAQYERERKRVVEISRRHSHELAEKDRTIDARDGEIATLKQQLQIQQEFMDLFNAEEEPKIADTVDIHSLYGKRFLFVGKLLESYSALKKNFPNSMFMESETANIKALKVDGVVLLIRNMSHSMYYKVMQNNQFAELPLIYCNSRNINNVYQAMLHGMQEQ